MGLGKPPDFLMIDLLFGSGWLAFLARLGDLIRCRFSFSVRCARNPERSPTVVHEVAASGLYVRPVLFLRPRSRYAAHVNLAQLALAGLCGAAAVGSGDPHLYVAAVFPAAAAIDDAALVYRAGQELVVRRAFRRRRSLAAARCRFGYTPRFRALTLYVTDGQDRIDVASYQVPSRAASTMARLDQALLDERTARARPAVRLVAADRGAMRATVAASTAYYRRPAFRRLVIAVMAFAALYVVVGSILFR